LAWFNQSASEFELPCCLYPLANALQRADTFKELIHLGRGEGERHDLLSTTLDCSFKVITVKVNFLWYIWRNDLIVSCLFHFAVHQSAVANQYLSASILSLFKIVGLVFNLLVSEELNKNRLPHLWSSCCLMIILEHFQWLLIS
jgi:hypothetical protein